MRFQGPERGWNEISRGWNEISKGGIECGMRFHAAGQENTETASFCPLFGSICRHFHFQPGPEVASRDCLTSPLSP